MGKPVTPEQKKFIRMNASRMTEKEMAEQLGIRPKTVSYLMVAMHLKRSKKQLGVKDKNFIRLNAASMSSSEIAAKLGFSERSVRRMKDKLMLTSPKVVQATPLHLVKSVNVSDFELHVNGILKERFRNRFGMSDYTVTQKFHEKYANEIADSGRFEIFKVVASKFPPITEEEMADAGKPIMKLVEPEQINGARDLYSDHSPFKIAK